MKIIKISVLCVMAFLTGIPFLHAQLSFTFSSTLGVYTYNAGTPILSPSTDDGLSAATNIGFTFNYGCNSYTNFIVSSNGFLSLGSVATDPASTNALGTTGQGPIIAPLWDDLETGTAGNVNYKLTGVAGSRILTIEWLKMLWQFSAASPSVSFQVKLYEANGRIDFVYRQEAGTVSTGSASIGLNGGSSATDFYSVNTTPAAVYGTETSTLSTRPAPGRTYTWVPNSMTFTSSTCIQPDVSNVKKCDVNQDIIALQVVTGGSCNPGLSLTQLQISMTGSTIPGTNTNDVTKIHIYYTGNSSTFSPINEFFAGGTTPAAGTITIAGSQALQSGTNYFWVAYDMNSSTATTGDVVDAQCTRATIGGIARVPTTTSPAGTRTIVACPAAPGGGTGIGSTLAFWVKANAGTSTTTNGAVLNSWNDQSGNVRNATAASNQPSFANNTTDNINFNPVIKFDGASTYMTIPSNGALSIGSNNYSFYFVINPGPQHNTVPGKIIASGACNTVDGILAFDIRGTNEINDSWDKDDNSSPDNVFTPNIPFLASFIYDNGSNTRNGYVNGVSVSTNTPTGTRAGTDDNYSIGYRISCPNEYYQGTMAELVSVLTNQSAAQKNRTESYLSIKYGLTLGNNGSTTAYYVNTSGATIWAANTGYHYNVAGIGKESVSESLDQPKSISVGATSDIITMANSNFTTPVTMAHDGDYLIWGNNNLPLYNGITFSYIHGGPNTSIAAQLKRIWRTQLSGAPTGNVIVEVDMSQISGPTGNGTNANANIRLLVDDNTNFSDGSAGEHTYSPNAGFTATGGKIYFTVPYSSIQAGQGFFTIGSTDNINSPLPIQFGNFTGQCNGQGISLTWNAPSATGNSFTIERSADGAAFSELTTVPGAVNSNPTSYYSYTDTHPLTGSAYYRLRETGPDGTPAYSPIITLTGCPAVANNITISPNPFNGIANVTCQLNKDAVISMVVYNSLGQKAALICSNQHYSEGIHQFAVDLGNSAKGIYFLQITINDKTQNYKLIRK